MKHLDWCQKILDFLGVWIPGKGLGFVMFILSFEAKNNNND